MWIVRLALNRPYTFIVLALLVLILSPVVILRTPTDIFPSINIPVIAVSWTYTGLSPEEMEGRITTVYERVLTTVVDNIEHIESTTVNGTAVVKIYLQPNASIDRANAQVTAVSQTILRQLPPGSLPPLIVDYNASTVPILQLSLSGNGLTEPQLNDIALNFLRTQLVTVPGAAVPFPYGGKTRQVMVNLNPRLLQSKGLSPNDVLTALGNQNFVLPGGTMKMSDFEYDVDLNADLKSVPEFNNLPIKTVGNSVIYRLATLWIAASLSRTPADVLVPGVSFEGGKIPVQVGQILDSTLIEDRAHFGAVGGQQGRRGGDGHGRTGAAQGQFDIGFGRRVSIDDHVADRAGSKASRGDFYLINVRDQVLDCVLSASVRLNGGGGSLGHISDFHCGIWDHGTCIVRHCPDNRAINRLGMGRGVEDSARQEYAQDATAQKAHRAHVNCKPSRLPIRPLHNASQKFVNDGRAAFTSGRYLPVRLSRVSGCQPPLKCSSQSST
jgi:AcrB/AcrD/AcrF family